MASTAHVPVDGWDPERLLAIVATVLDVERSELDLDTDLRATGRLDSLAIVSLVSLIEDELDVRIGIDDIVPDNFSSARRIAELMGRVRR